jgi:cation efflux family protein
MDFIFDDQDTAVIHFMGNQFIGRLELNAVAIAPELIHQIGASLDQASPIGEVVEDFVNNIVSGDVEEVLSINIVIWQLANVNSKRRTLAHRLIGWAFFGFAIYILVQSIAVLLFQSRPEQSVGGILWLALTLTAMLALAFGKDRTGKNLGDVVLQTEARVTLVDAYLAASVLVGLILNAAIGWWWADPVAALVILFYGFKEGFHSWQESNSRLECRATDSN